MLPCGVCGEICSHLGARGQIVVCRNCEAKATTLDGRPLAFYETLTKREDGVYQMMGPGAYYKEPDPDAGEKYVDQSDFGIWIDGSRVYLYEGVAGWLGLIVRE